MDNVQSRRKMCHINIYSISSLLFLIISLHCANAGPVIRSSRMVREIYPEVEQEIPDSSQTQVCIVGDVVYGSGENVPSEQPCLKCACAPPEVRCETEICVQQPGCKTIHRPNKCCPDYQCECQHEGKTYANGERLPAAPGGECLVCYCRGGEVQCAEVGCYTRSDCDSRYVKGQCCPIYDHCPPREPLSDRVLYTTIPSPSSSEQDFTPSWISTGLPLNTTEYDALSQSVTQETPEEGSGEYEPPVSSEDTLHSSPTTPNPIMNDEPTQRPSTPITFSIKEIESKTNNKRQDDERINVVNKVDKSTQTDSNGRPQITIQEVIPSRTEYKITSPPQKEVPPRSVSASPLNVVSFKAQDQTLSTANPIKLLTDSSNELSDVESYASEKTEVYDHPPPVLRIGDQLLFIKQGQLVPEKDASTPTPVITLIGAEGLQIGLGSGELLEHEIIPMNHDEPSVTSQTFISTNPTLKKLDEAEIPLDISTKNTIEEFVSNEATAETTTFHAIVEIEEISDDNLEKTNSSELLEPNDSSNEFITVSEKINDTSNSETVKNETKILEMEPETSSITPIETSTQTVQENPTTSKLNDITSKPTKSLINKILHTDNAEYIPEENPYYPPIPEDIMIFSQEESTRDSTAEIVPSSITRKLEVPTLSTIESVEAVSGQTESVETVTESNFKQAETDNKSGTLGEEPIKPRTLVANISSAELISVIPLKTIDESKTESSQESEKFSDNNSEKPIELATTPVVLETSTFVSKSDDINIKEDSSTSEGMTRDTGKENNKELVSDILREKKKEIIQGDSIGTEKEVNMKILPEVLDMRSNKTVPGNETSSQEWLKSETPTKITIPLAKDFNVYIPLLNEKAALPDSLLKMPAPTDLDLDDQNSSTEIINHDRIEVTTDSMVLTNYTKMDVVESVEEIRNKNVSFVSTENVPTDSLAQINYKKSGKIVAKEIHQKEEHGDKSTETMEVNEEFFDSAESTTSSAKHSLLMSNEDASVEMIQNDSAPMDASDLVETVPGFENTSSKIIDGNKSEQDLQEQPAGSPKLEVEMIEVNTQKEVTEDVSHVEIKDFHDEIQKRDVVKKVLTDTFENPKENILTELTTNDNKPQEISQTHFNEEQNIVRPTDNHDLSTRSLNSNLTNPSQVNGTTVEKEQVKGESNKEQIEDKKEMKVIQKVNHDNSKVNIHDSTENLDTGALGALRDFFKSQFRRHDSRSVD